MPNWQFSLAHSLGSESQSFLNIFGFQIGVGLQDFGWRHAFPKHADNRRDWNAKITDAGNPPHLIRVYGNASKWFHRLVRECLLASY